MQMNRFIIPLFLLISALVLPNVFAADVPHTVLEGHRDVVLSVTFSPDGDMLASKSRDGAIKIWNPNTRQLLRTINTSKERGIAFSPDGGILASTGGDRVVSLWNPNTGKLLKTFKRHDDSVVNVTFNHDGTVLASGSRNGKIHLWNVETGKLIRVLGGNNLDGLAFSPDGSIIANGGAADANVKVWNSETGQLLHTLEPDVHDVFDVAFSPKGHILASVGWGGMDFWDANTGELLRSFPRERGRFLMSVAFSPDGHTLACGKDFEGISLWDVDKGLLLENLRIDREDVYDVAFSPDGRILASASNDHMVRLWEITPPEEIEPPPIPDFLTDENLKTWTEDFNAGHLNSWKKRELQRERVTWQVQNDHLHVQTKPWCNGRLNVGNHLEEQTNYTLRFTALPINVEQIQAKLSIISTDNANVGIFLGKDPKDELIHPFEYAYQFADHRLGSPENMPRTSAPRIALKNLNEIDVVFDRGHFYLYSNDEYIVDFKVDTLETIDLLGIAVFPKVCQQVADVVVDDFIISGTSIPDAVSLNVRAKGKVAVLWGNLKQN